MKTESLEYDEDKLDGCISQNSFCDIIDSCPVDFNSSINILCDHYLSPFSTHNLQAFMRYFFWITAILVITGNAYVIISSVLKTSCFKRAWPSVLLQCNHTVILNIAVADFMTGIYLITISILNVVKLRFHHQKVVEWVGSLGCSIVGSIALISSEASCFLMVTLTSFRLYHVYRPMSFMAASSRSWGVCIFISWFVAVFLGVIPILETKSEYFLSYSTVKTSSGIYALLSKSDIDNITCSLARLDRSNYSDHEFEFELEYISKHFSRNAAQYQFDSCLKSYPTYQDFKDHRDEIKVWTSLHFIEPPKGKLGFYSATDSCLPRFFAKHPYSGWEYSTAIITLNLSCFVFIAVSYILIYKRLTSKRPINAAVAVDLQIREAELQKRIARIVITDFACWVPICIMAYVAFSGLLRRVGLYEIVAGFLLPINSALNPLLYSVDLSKLFNRLRCQLLKKCRN